VFQRGDQHRFDGKSPGEFPTLIHQRINANNLQRDIAVD
jgi:hypothetical protein